VALESGTEVSGACLVVPEVGVGELYPPPHAARTSDRARRRPQRARLAKGVFFVLVICLFLRIELGISAVLLYAILP